MSTLEWDNIEKIFKKKPNYDDIYFTLKMIGDKMSTLFDVHELCLNFVVSIEKYDNDYFAIEDVLRKNKLILKNFFDWLFTVVLTTNYRYLNKNYANEFKDHFTKIYDENIPFLKKEHYSNEHYVIRLLYYLIFLVLMLELSGNIKSILEINERKKKIFAFTIGNFYKLNTDLVHVKPTIYWLYGNPIKSQNLIDVNVKNIPIYTINSFYNWENYSDENAAIYRIQKDTDYGFLKNIIQGKKFVVLNNQNLTLTQVSYFYIVSDKLPNRFLEIKENSIYLLSEE